MKSMNMNEVLTILFKHKGKIIIAFLATVITALIGTMMMDPTYESDANLLIKYGREYVYRPEVGDKITQPKTDLTGIVNAETQIITSQDLMEQVVRTVGVNNLYPDIYEANKTNPQEMMNQALAKFTDALSVKGLEDSGVIQLSFQHKNPKVAARVINTMVDAFKARHLDAFIDAKSSSFLEQKTNTYAKELQDTEQKLADLKTKHTTYDLDEQRTLLLHQRSDLDALHKQSQDRVAEMGRRLAALNAQVTSVNQQASSDMSSDRYGVLDNAKKEVLDMKMKEQDLLKKYTDTSETVTSLRTQIETAEKFIDEQEKDLRTKVAAGNPVVQELQRQIVATQADYQSEQSKSAVMQGQLAELDKQLANLAVPENDLRDLQRQLATAEDNYKTYNERLQEAQMTEDMNRLKMTNISVIQAATVPADPIKPRKAVNLGIGVILGGILGVGLAFLTEYLSQGFTTPLSVERRLGLPVLAVVPFQKYLAR